MNNKRRNKKTMNNNTTNKRTTNNKTTINITSLARDTMDIILDYIDIDEYLIIASTNKATNKIILDYINRMNKNKYLSRASDSKIDIEKLENKKKIITTPKSVFSSFERMKWIYTSKSYLPHWEKTVATSYCCRYNLLEGLEWLQKKFKNSQNLKNAWKINITAYSGAATNGHINVIEYLLHKKIPYNKQLVKVAVYNNQYETVKWLCENAESKNIKLYKEPEITNICTYFTSNFDLLKLLIEYNFEHDWRTIAYTALNNNINMFKYLLKQNCDIENRTGVYAAQNNNLEMLQYAHKYYIKKHNMIFSNDLCTHAIKNNNPEMLQYLIDNRYMVLDESYKIAETINNKKINNILYENENNIFT